MGLYYYSPFRLLLLETVHPSSAGRCGVIRPSIGPQHNFPGKVNLFDTARQNTQWADSECMWPDQPWHNYLHRTWP